MGTHQKREGSYEHYYSQGQLKPGHQLENMSNNEAAFYLLNRGYRGREASSQMAKRVIRLTQESCFQQQKRDCISLMINKARYFHPAGGKDDTVTKESFAPGEPQAGKHKSHTEEDKKRRDLILK